jgi:hypothetical protein
MTSVVFVHGTGVRVEGHDATLTRVKHLTEKILQVSPENVLGCNWGEKYGVRLDLIDLMLPGSRGRAAAGELSDAQKEIAIWNALLEDPFLELRLAPWRPNKTSAIGPAGGLNLRPSQRLLELPARAQGIDLQGTGIRKEEHHQALETVFKNQDPKLNVKVNLVTAQAADSYSTIDDPGLTEILARAIVATVSQKYRQTVPGSEPAAILDPEVRKVYLERLVKGLNPNNAKGLVDDWVRDRLLDVATSILKEHRNWLMDVSGRFIGDILLYLRHGDEIRAEIKATILKANQKGPVMLLCHSLGADIVFDMLCSDPTLPVKLLVSVGAQIPYFYAMKAFETLEPDYEVGDKKGLSTKAMFEAKWLNVANPNDFLSFLCKKVFLWKNLSEMVLESGIPFPFSHGAYFEDERVYEEIKKVWE